MRERGYGKPAVAFQELASNLHYGILGYTAIIILILILILIIIAVILQVQKSRYKSCIIIE